MTDSVRRLADEVRAGVNDAMKSLRADLASAARQAKEESQRQGTTSNLHTESNRALHDADIVLNEFRQQMRTDLRLQAARSRVPAETVPELRRQLADVRSSILGSLGR